MSFAGITTRTNGQTVDASWWEALKTAGVLLENFIGASGLIAKTAFTFANNTASPTNVTGLVFDKTAVKSAIATISLRLKTDTNELYSIWTLSLIYRELTATWDITPDEEGDLTGAAFSITSAGQVQYTTPNMAGTNFTSAGSYFKAESFGL